MKKERKIYRLYNDITKMKSTKDDTINFFKGLAHIDNFFRIYKIICYIEDKYKKLSIKVKPSFNYTSKNEYTNTFRLVKLECKSNSNYNKLLNDNDIIKIFDINKIIKKSKNIIEIQLN